MRYSLFHPMADIFQIIKNLMDIPGNPGRIMNRLRMQPRVFRHMIDTGNVINIITHAHRIKSQLTKRRKAFLPDL